MREHLSAPAVSDRDKCAAFQAVAGGRAFGRHTAAGLDEAGGRDHAQFLGAFLGALPVGRRQD
jgi:hypothetical protein